MVVIAVRAVHMFMFMLMVVLVVAVRAVDVWFFGHGVFLRNEIAWNDLAAALQLHVAAKP